MNGLPEKASFSGFTRSGYSVRIRCRPLIPNACMYAGSLTGSSAITRRSVVPAGIP